MEYEIATATRAFAHLGYVHAFGHVSIRTGDTVLITPTRPPLEAQRATDVLEVDLDGHVRRGDPAGRPIEVYLHLGIYAARRDVAAICRTHAPGASVWPAGGCVPLIRHGFGGIVGEVATFEEVDLVHDAALGRRAAASLGRAGGLMLRGNGVLTVGASLGEAAARMWSLEERCAHVLRRGPEAPPFSEAEVQARSRWYPAEAERIWVWLRHLGASPPNEARHGTTIAKVQGAHSPWGEQQ